VVVEGDDGSASRVSIVESSIAHCIQERNTILQLQCSVKQITLTRKRRRLYRSEPVLIRHAEVKESDSCLDSCGVHFLLFVEKFLWVTRYLYGIWNLKGK
jgi:hypothetical protein